MASQASSSSAMLVLLLSIVLIGTATADIKSMPGVQSYYCSKCIAKSWACTPKLARNCGTCNPRTRYDRQSARCEYAGCTFCKRWGNGAKFPCNSKLLHRVCKGGQDSYPRPSPEVQPREPRSSKRCVWRANGGNVVIPLAATGPLPAGWSRVSRNGKQGIGYEMGKGGGIDSAGTRGIMCFKVQVKMTGNYYLSAVTYAPHNTEHNDAWAQTSKGFSLWQRGNKWRDAPADEWFKGYQNSGGMSTDFLTKDHDGHRFVIEGVKAGEVFQVCLAGRSYRYEMYYLVVAKCSGGTCKGDGMHGIDTMATSTCS